MKLLNLLNKQIAAVALLAGVAHSAQAAQNDYSPFLQCGSYRAEAKETEVNFAGLEIPTMEFQIVTNSGEVLRADYQSHSEGGNLKAFQTLEINQQTGEALKYLELNIESNGLGQGGDKTYLILTNEVGRSTVIPCQ